jgi:hypothetical protein
MEGPAFQISRQSFFKVIGLYTKHAKGCGQGLTDLQHDARPAGSWAYDFPANAKMFVARVGA